VARLVGNEAVERLEASPHAYPGIAGPNMMAQLHEAGGLTMNPGLTAAGLTLEGPAISRLIPSSHLNATNMLANLLILNILLTENRKRKTENGIIGPLGE
jgi:hypothetical protein